MTLKNKYRVLGTNGEIINLDTYEGDYLLLGDNYNQITGRLNFLTDGSYMFYKRPITSFDIPLPNLTTGSNMFSNCKNLTGFNIDLSVLKNSSNMFSSCSSLESFTIDLPALTIGSFMFFDCTSLISFTSELSRLVTGIAMFNGCSSLNLWAIDLPNLYDATQMFYGCVGLESFSSDLSTLTIGTNMFNACCLDLVSIQSIASTIKNVTGVTGTHPITIGMSTNIQGDTDLASVLETIRNKGWTVTEQYN